MTALYSPEPTHALYADTPPVRWRPELLSNQVVPLKVAVLHDLYPTLCFSSPASRRAVETAVAALRKAGAEVTEWEPLAPWPGFFTELDRVWAAGNSPDGNAWLHAALEGAAHKSPSLLLSVTTSP